MKRTIIMLLIAALMLCSLTACGGREECDSIIHGKFYLGNETDFAEALAVKDGKIVYVGDEKGLRRFKAAEEYSFDDTQLIIPGITDAHCHASMAWENKLYSANFTTDDNKEDYIRIITEFVNANPAVTPSGATKPLWKKQALRRTLPMYWAAPLKEMPTAILRQVFLYWPAL